jgi:hypothetical protein
MRDRPIHTSVLVHKTLNTCGIGCDDAQNLESAGLAMFRELNQPGRHGLAEWSPKSPNIEYRPLAFEGCCGLSGVDPSFRMKKFYAVAQSAGCDIPGFGHQFLMPLFGAG